MNMQTVRSPSTGKITCIFDLDSVEVMEVSDCGSKIWVLLKSGCKFMLFENAAHHDTTVDEVMEKFSSTYKKLAETNNA